MPESAWNGDRTACISHELMKEVIYDFYERRLLRQELVQVLFWSSLGVVYDSDIGCFQGDRISPAPPFAPSGLGTEEIFWQPVMMPSGDLYPSID